MKLGILAGVAAVTAVILCRPGPNADSVVPTVSVPSSSQPVPRRNTAHEVQQPAFDPEDSVPSRLREQAALVVSDGTESAWNAFLNSFPDEDVRRVLNQLVNTEDRALAELRYHLIRRWAEADPVAAGNWAAGLADPAVQKEALEQVALAWFQHDPDEAAAWAMKLPAGAGKTAAVMCLGGELSRVNSLKALELVSTLPAGQERDDLVVHGISQWAASNPSASACWAVQIPDEALRKRALSAVGTAWAVSDSASAAGFTLSYLPPGTEQDCAVVGIIQRWTQTAPAAAAGWVAQMPEAPVKVAAVQNLVSIWTEQDPEASAGWLKSLPSGPLRDEGIAVFAQVMAPLCFEYAQSWAGSIEDVSRRRLCTQAIGRFAPVASGGRQ